MRGSFDTADVRDITQSNNGRTRLIENIKESR